MNAVATISKSGSKRLTLRLLTVAVAVAMIMVLALAIAPAVSSTGAGVSASGNGGSASSHLKPSTVLAITAPFIALPFSSPPSADVNQAVQVSSGASGGLAPYTFTWTADPSLGCTPSTAVTIDCTPTTDVGSPFSITVNACDSTLPIAICGGAPVSVGFSVYSDPTTTNPVASPTEVDVGQQVTFSTTASGGLAPYSYFWFLLPNGCVNTNSATLTCTPTAPSGSFFVHVDLTDANGYGLAYGTLLFTVDPALTTTTPTVTPPTIDLGQSVTFKTTTSGGLPGYSWSWLGDASLIPCSAVDTATTSTLTCTPSGTGTLVAYVAVTDANSNQIVSPGGSVVVYADPTTTVPDPSQPSADIGQTITFSTSPSDGSGSYTTFTWGDSSGSLGCKFVNDFSIKCVPTATGSYIVSVDVTDSNGVSTGVETLSSYLVYSDPTTTTPIATPPVLDVGQPLTISTTTSGGLTPYTYVWHNLPPGCSSITHVVSCSPTGSGTFSVYVDVTDANGFTITSGAVSVTVYADPTTTTPIASPTSVDLGQGPVTFSTTTSWGLAPYSYVWHNLPPGCSTVNLNTLSCTPTGTGTFSVYVVVTDSNSFVVTSGTLTFHVYADPTIGTPVPSHPGADLGEQVWFTAAAALGLPPYSYVWHGLPPGCLTSNHDPLSCTPKGGGTFHIYVVLTDANHYVVTSGSLTFTVVQSLDIHTPSVNHNPAEVGDTVTFTVKASTMGMPPYTYTWNGLPGGCVSANSVTITCTLTLPTGTFHVTVTTTDANGAVKTSAALKFTVQPADLAVSPPGHGPGSVGISELKIRE